MRYRDPVTGRFCKPPKAKPLPDELVKGLREGQPAYTDWSRVPITLEILEVTRPVVPVWKVTRRDENPA